MIRVETYEDPGDEDHPLIYESIEKLCENTFAQAYGEAGMNFVDSFCGVSGFSPNISDELA